MSAMRVASTRMATKPRAATGGRPSVARPPRRRSSPALPRAFHALWIGVTLARTAGVGYIPRAEEIVLGGRTLMVLAGATLFGGLLFGLIPAIHGAGGAGGDGFRSLGRRSTGSVAVRRLRGILAQKPLAPSLADPRELVKR